MQESFPLEGFLSLKKGPTKLKKSRNLTCSQAKPKKTQTWKVRLWTNQSLDKYAEQAGDRLQTDMHNVNVCYTHPTKIINLDFSALF